MARRRRRRSRRSFGNLVSFPSVGALKDYNPLGRSVNSTDLFVGAGIGMVGGVAVKMAINKLDEIIGGKLPQIVRDYIGPISSIGAGALAYMVQRKRNAHRGTGHFVGATLVGVSPFVWGLLQRNFPEYFSGYVDVNLGLLTEESSIAGLLVDEPSMAGLANYSTSDDFDLLDAA